MNDKRNTNNKKESFDISKQYEPKYLTISTIIDFGKYKGMRTSEVLNEDPRYLKWCYEKAIVRLAPNIKNELGLN